MSDRHPTPALGGIPQGTPAADRAAARTGHPTRSALAIAAWVALGAIVGLIGVQPIGGAPTASLPVTVVGVAVTCYLAAAVFGARWVGWVGVGVVPLLLVPAELLDIPRIAVFITLGVILGIIGLVVRPRATTPQALAAIGYLAAAAFALLLVPQLGLALAGIALAAHAVWDFIAFRRDEVVNRSLALACMGLDLVIGAGCVVWAFA